MHLIVIGIWMAVMTVVGHNTIRDIKAERAEHKMAEQLKAQEKMVHSHKLKDL